MKLPTLVGKLLERADVIVTQMEDHLSTFSKPPISFKQVRADMAALAAAQAAFNARGGTMERREEARRKLAADMKQLHAYVQQIASGDPENATLIASYAAMTLRPTGPYNKPDLIVKQLGQGRLRAVARTVKGARAYDWQFGPDGEKWNGAVPTTRAQTMLDGFEPGEIVWVRFRVITAKGAGDWSQKFRVMVL